MSKHQPRKFDRDYSDAEVALFARYTAQRASHQPSPCTRGPQCWVLHGPPCYRTHNGPGGRCIECDGEVK